MNMLTIYQLTNNMIQLFKCSFQCYDREHKYQDHACVFSSANCNSSIFNLTIECENGEISNKLLSVIAVDDPVSYFIYGQYHDLLDKSG